METWQILLIIGIIISGIVTFSTLLKRAGEREERKRKNDLEDATVEITEHGDHTDIDIYLEGPDNGPGPDIAKIVEKALLEVKSPDTEKPFAKLSGNTISTVPATETISSDTEKPKDKPKRTYKKRAPKPKDTPEA